MAKFAFFGHDTGPSQGLAPVSALLAGQGHTVTDCLLYGKTDLPDPSVLASKPLDSDVLVVGMSTPAPRAAIELAAIDSALAQGKPFAVYADAFDAWTRLHFRHALLKASMLFVVNEQQRVDAQRAFREHPGLTIVAVGNPEWYKYYEPADQAASRALVGASDDELVVLIPCTKAVWMNMGRMQATLNAAAKSGKKVRVVINMRPDDQTAKDLYEAQTTVGNKLRPYNLSVVLSDQKADALLPGANLIVGPSTSASVHAMARGIPIIDLNDTMTSQWVLGDSGQTRTYPARNGGALEVEDAVGLRMFLSYQTGGELNPETKALCKKRYDDMREKQKLLVPRFAQGEVEERMAQALLSLTTAISA